MGLMLLEVGFKVLHLKKGDPGCAQLNSELWAWAGEGQRGCFTPFKHMVNFPNQDHGLQEGFDLTRTQQLFPPTLKIPLHERWKYDSSNTEQYFRLDSGL